ncbi:hypothetical protein V8G54_014168 [Vigna mungo]|uniref:Uncharacterized protein n=1 Tax=Vigna mungo TaxID=3915 RepID=A0AAQ3NK59_VIGMU
MGNPRRSKTADDLHSAARSGDLIAVQSILASNPLAVNSRDKHSRTPLHLAAFSGQAEVVTYLCKHKADAGASAMDDMAAIHFASQKGHLEVVRALLSAGASLKASTRKGMTSLHYAVQGSHLELVKYLAKKGANLAAQTKAGKTPLDLANNGEIRSFLEEFEKSANNGELGKKDKDKAEEFDPKTSELGSEGDLNAEPPNAALDEEKNAREKRKGNEDDARVESSQPKKARVKLSHLQSSDDTQEEENIKLRYLRTLGIFVAGSKPGCGLGELHSLKLGGTLRIKGFENIPNERDVKQANLIDKMIFNHPLTPPSTSSLIICARIDAVSNLKFPCLPSVEELPAGSIDEMTSFTEGVVRNMVCLKTLNIHAIKGVKVLPDQISRLGALELLFIQDWYGLEYFSEHALDGLTCLRTLIIGNCKQLKSLSEGVRHLTCLESLEISNCPKLVALPSNMSQLTVLRKVSIRLCSSLPYGLQRVPFLRILGIHHCKYMANLQELSIMFCEELRSLPSSIQRLTDLSKLRIEECPHLEAMQEGNRE